MTDVRRCPLCRTSDQSVLFAEARLDAGQLDQFAFASRKLPEYMHHRLQLCRACDLVYVDSPPETASLQEAYAEAAFDSGVEAAYAARTYVRILGPMFSKLPDRVGAVDIGTGDGVFLRELQNAGFSEVWGVEPSRAPIAAAAPEIRDRIRLGFFQRGAFPDSSCALVTCFQTIEHVADPVALCEGARDLLKPGGLFCLVGHNRRAASAKILGRRSPIYDIEHLQLFSSASLTRLLSQTGFRNIKVRPFWNRYPAAYWTKLFPFPARMKRALISGLNAVGVGQLPLSVPAGNLVAWGVK